MLSKLCARLQRGPFTCSIYLGQFFEVVLFHFKGEETEASKWQNHSFSLGASYFKIIMIFLLQPTSEARGSTGGHGETIEKTLPLYSLGFFIISSGSLMFTLMLLEFGLTYLSFCENTNPSYTSHFLTLHPVHPFCAPFGFLVPKSPYLQPFGDNFEAYLGSCSSVFCNLEDRDCVFSTCHAYASYSMGT